ncbi:hypothetical protein SKAU_G00199060 [Synaphobranchus kaupii]|uniref:Uncharacterized protein n=1 Tax=Synaphobranchus kaupii TaxID=118154 RepID=A0A9Q1IVX6_SYNKA|nr:hypothetical protein SKAU_G00199060 [Synaphobranchus kaupii]
MFVAKWSVSALPQEQIGSAAVLGPASTHGATPLSAAGLEPGRLAKSRETVGVTADAHSVTASPDPPRAGTLTPKPPSLERAFLSRRP